MTTQLDEQALRRPTFRPGHKIRLADGQEWQFPPLRVVWRLNDTEDGLLAEFDLPAEHRALLEAVDAARDAGDGQGLMLAELRLFAYLARLNYELDRPAVDRLFRIAYGPGSSPEDFAMRDALLAVATGNEPN